MFNIEVFNACQMPFWPSQNAIFCFGGTSQKCARQTSPITAWHNIHWLQFVTRNIVGLQSWHSNRHFQFSITLAISIVQLWLGNDCNFSLASTTTYEREFSKHNWVKSDRRSQLKLETLNALMRVSLCGLPLENMDWARIFNTRKPTKNWRALPPELDAN